MVLGTSKKQTTQARRLIEKFKVKERLKFASSKPLRPEAVVAQNKPLADFGNPIKTGIKISSCSLLFQVFESHAVPPERLHVDCLTLVRG